MVKNIFTKSGRQRMRKWLWLITCFCIVGVCFAYTILKNLQVKRNDVSISINDPDVKPVLLSIAVIGDTHLTEHREALAAFGELLLEIKASKPDLIIFVGDYITRPNRVNNISKHREAVINALKLVDPIPRAAVLGNYESWSGAEKWLAEFERLGVDVLENEVTVLETAKGPVCIRGLGDKFTKRFRYVDYPAGCKELSKLTITHDPAGAFDSRVTGLVIAGHTHCGQVSLPYIGPLWVPSDAPSLAHCGLYQDSIRTVFVTSGVGTSILPLRFGTQSHWDFISLESFE
jgi:uncharacterized protein